MRIALSFASLACGAAVLSACATTPGGATPEDPYAVQVATPGQATCIATSTQDNAAGAAATNTVRARAGLPAVRANSLLAQVAANHACDMAERGRMTHLGSSTSGPGARLRAVGYQPRISAENIAAGPFSRDRVLGEWAGSRGHLDNILLPQVQDYGIGQALGADGRTRYWVAVYSAGR